MGPDGSFDLHLSPSKPFADISSLMSPPHQPRPPTPPPQPVRPLSLGLSILILTVLHGNWPFMFWYALGRLSTHALKTRHNFQVQSLSYYSGYVLKKTLSFVVALLVDKHQQQLELLKMCRGKTKLIATEAGYGSMEATLLLPQVNNVRLTWKDGVIVMFEFLTSFIVCLALTTLQLASWVVVLAKLLVVVWLHYFNN